MYCHAGLVNSGKIWGTIIYGHVIGGCLNWYLKAISVSGIVTMQFLIDTSMMNVRNSHGNWEVPKRYQQFQISLSAEKPRLINFLWYQLAIHKIFCPYCYFHEMQWMFVEDFILSFYETSPKLSVASLKTI